MKWTEKISQFIKKNSTKLDITFFVGGFIFDAWLVSYPDKLLVILHQAFYLFLIATIIHYELLFQLEKWRPAGKVQKVWPYKDLALHFLLGTLLNIYSLFYIKSASLFSSLVFLLLMITMIFANELPFVKKSKKINLKVGLYSICLFSFFSVVFPIIFGFIGIIPFSCSILSTLLILTVQFKVLRKAVDDSIVLIHAILTPVLSVVLIFSVFYFLGLIPPVPLSVKEQGVYHSLEKRDSHYYLSTDKKEKEFWSFGKSNFHAEPGDKIYFYSQIYSPARISDEIIVHWLKKDNLGNWVSLDKVPVIITGGREEGFRIFTFKSNYDAGEWKIVVETSTGVEISRLYFDIKIVDVDPNRSFRIIEK